MAQVVREVRERTVEDDAPAAPAAAAKTTPTEQDEYAMTVAERVVYYIGGAVMAVIGLRILLSLLGANRTNEFASFIYGVSYPFVAPFFGLFNYEMQYGISRFEFESLVALVVWGLLTVAVAKLVTIGSRQQR